MSKMFYGCTLIKSIDLSRFTFSQVSNIEDMISNCNSLISIELSNLNNLNFDFLSLFENHEGYIRLNYINLLNSGFSKTLFINFYTNKISSRILYICVSDKAYESLAYFLSENEIRRCCNSDNLICGKPNENKKIIVRYNNECNYDKGFINEYRTGIRIFLNGLEEPADSQIKLKNNSELIIYLDSPVESLLYFFSSEKDPNVKYINSIDFSSFNLSNIYDMSHLFEGCTSLESVTFGNFDASQVIDMSKMFYGCSIIKSINLSSFTFSQVSNIEDMISNCKSLISIDLSSIKNSNLHLESLFKNHEGYIRLNYINLLNSGNKLISLSPFIYQYYSPKILYICVSDKTYEELLLYSSEDQIKRCCNVGNEYLKCGMPNENNKITVRYNNECNYDKEFVNDYRSSIKRIFLNGLEEPTNRQTKIENNSELIIYFDSPVETLAYFFSSEYDPNVIYINSLDFSSFNSSNIDDMSHLFEGCTSLESVTFGNFDSSQVIDMSKMFYGCSLIKSIDLSRFTLEKIQIIDDMISNCNSLISIDLSSIKNSNLHLESLFKNHEGYIRLKYMNLLNAIIENDYLKDFIEKGFLSKTVSKLNLCLEENTILELESVFGNKLEDKLKLCCNDNNENLKCRESNENNKIIINFNNKFNYNKGFINEFRTRIEKLYLNGTEEPIYVQ